MIHSRRFLPLLCLMQEKKSAGQLCSKAAVHIILIPCRVWHQMRSLLQKNPTSANPIILLDYGRLMLGGPSPSASGAFWYQVADKKSVTSTRQILGRCSESMRWWWWSRPHLMRSSLGLRGWPWRGWCTLLHISGAWSHPVWHSGWSGWERKENTRWKRPTALTLRLWYTTTGTHLTTCVCKVSARQLQRSASPNTYEKNNISVPPPPPKKKNF